MARIIKKRIDVKTSYEEQIEALQKEIELLSSLIPLREYFLKIKDNERVLKINQRRKKSCVTKNRFLCLSVKIGV